MPKLRHDAVVEILQNEPELVLQLLACAGMHLQFGSRVRATVADSDLSDRQADDDGHTLTLLSDNVFVFKSGGAKIAVITEVQTGKPGRSRSLSWPAYAANARARHKCDSILMVFATNTNAASGSARTILTGHPGWNLTPLISGIGRTPGTPPKGGRFAAELVLLRIITGELKLTSHDARMFALAAIKSAPFPRRLRYSRYIRALTPSKARRHLEELMRLELKDDFIDGMLDQGHLRGAREMMLQLLDIRFNVPEDIRKQVEECTEIANIHAWFARAITATSLDDVFVELSQLRVPDEPFSPPVT